MTCPIVGQILNRFSRDTAFMDIHLIFPITVVAVVMYISTSVTILISHMLIQNLMMTEEFGKRHK